jgi:WD40 repeat protein
VKPRGDGPSVDPAAVKIGVSYFVRFSPDGAWIASGSATNVQVRRPDSAEPQFRFRPRDPSGGDFSPDSRSLVVKTRSGALGVCGPLDGAPRLSSLRRGRGEGGRPRYSACGKFVLDASWSGRLSVLDSTTGACVDRRDFPSDMLREVMPTADGMSWIVAHSPRATTASDPPEPDYFTVWTLPLADVPNHVVRPGLRHVRGAAAGPGRVLALVNGAPPTRLSIVDAETGEVLRARGITTGGTPHEMAWGPNGTLAVVEHHAIGVYSDDLTPLGRYELEYACDVSFSPRGDIVALGSWKSGRVIPVSDLVT